VTTSRPWRSGSDPRMNRTSYSSGCGRLNRFPPQSIFLVASVYVGGVGTVAGAWLTAVSVASGVVQQLLHFASDCVLWVNLASGLLLLQTLFMAPDRVAVLVIRQWHQLRQPRSGRRRGGAGVGARSLVGQTAAPDRSDRPLNLDTGAVQGARVDGRL
jgi:hypothetical protein